MPVKTETVIKDDTETTVYTADESKKNKGWKRTQELTTNDKFIQYYYDNHGRVEFKTQTPLKNGKPIKQSSHNVIGYLETLKLFYNANDEVEKSINIKQQGLEIVTTTTQYYYDAFGRRVAKSSKTKKESKLSDNLENLLAVYKTVQKEKTEKSTTLMLWDGNRQLQEYVDGLTFTTVYEQDSFVPVARLVSDKNELKIYHYHNDHLGTYM